MVDSLKIYDILKRGSLSDDQARVMTTAIQQAETDIEADFRAALRDHPTKADLAATEVRLIRWMFVFWVGQLGTAIALIKVFR